MKFFTFCVAASLPFALAGQDSSENKLTHQPTSSVFDVVITEIMADPDPTAGLPVAEYIEIFNRSANAVNLAGWTLFDGSSKVLTNSTILAGEYMIICANSDTAQFIGYGNIAGISSLSLTNGGDMIAIRNTIGLSIDSISFDDDWHNLLYKKDGGWSLERIDVDFTCFAATNWTSSINIKGGTPGAENSVNGVFTDNVSPVLLRAYCPDSTTIMIIFSEAMDTVSATNSQNYSLKNAGGIISAEMADETNKRVVLYLNDNLSDGIVGLIGVNGISDCAGNFVPGGNYAKFGYADTGSSAKIAINEILFNPFEGGYDFIELYNYGSRIIDISRMQLAALNLSTGEIDAMESISEEPWLIFPDDYLVLTENPEVVATHYRSTFPVNFIGVEDLLAMNIDEGHLAIILDGIRIDEIKYHEDFHYPLLENPKGVSLEKINPIRHSMDPGSWHSASTTSGFATPGLKNSQFAENAPVSKTITVQPEIFSPDQDGLDDVITFAISPGSPGFISNIRIYNSRGHVIFENAKNTFVGTHGTFTWDGISSEGTPASPGIYVAIVEIFNLEGVVENNKLAFVLAAKL